MARHTWEEWTESNSRIYRNSGPLATDGQPGELSKHYRLPFEICLTRPVNNLRHYVYAFTYLHTQQERLARMGLLKMDLAFVQYILSSSCPPSSTCKYSNKCASIE